MNQIFKAFCYVGKFNFNKSCIWIQQIMMLMLLKINLTLTRVVFECRRSYYIGGYVVFELNMEQNIYHNAQFNFNKSCIWIGKAGTTEKDGGTFNFNKSCIWIEMKEALERSVKVFNFNKSCIWIQDKKRAEGLEKNLTLTRVVFEFYAWR